MPPLKERQVPWGIYMPAPVEDIKRIVQPIIDDYTVLVNLGCGPDLYECFRLREKLGCTVIACDKSRKFASHARITSEYSEWTGVYPVVGDITRPDLWHNYLYFSGKDACNGDWAKGDDDIILANNIFVNLTRLPQDPEKVAALITFALKDFGWVFFIDHLRKDQGPYGDKTTHQEYKRRYQEALEQHRRQGDIWTSCPPRWVHHYSWEELGYLFPEKWYKRVINRTIPYTGDSGKVTNAVYLALQKIAYVKVSELCQHFRLQRRFFEK